VPGANLKGDGSLFRNNSTLAHPRKTLPSPLTPGRAYLQFSQVGSNTVLQRAFAVSPLRLLAPRTPGTARWVYVATYGGGLVGGDSIHMTIDVARGARALIASQASTKVYRSPIGARQDVRGCVDEDALLAILPDPIVCFSGSSFCQNQRYDLSGRASLVLVDWMTSGRHGSGERWAFNRYESRVEVRRNGRRLVYDGLRLSADEGALADRMERFNVCLMAILLGPLVSAAARSIVEAIASLPVEKDPDLVVSAARLRHDDRINDDQENDDGVVLRIAGLCVEQVGAVLRDHLRPLTPLLGDDPWIRKW